MRIIIIALVYCLLLSKTVFSNEVEVIELHETKSLDQLVLDQLTEEEDDDVSVTEGILEQEETISETSNQDDSISVEQSSIDTNNYWSKQNIDKINKYLSNSKNIKSKQLEIEFFNYLKFLDLNFEDKNNRDIFFLIVNYFYEIGDITTAYNLINNINFEIDENLNFYSAIELNYLLSTFQLENVCSYKDELPENINLKYFLGEKIDIFCLILADNNSEAELLNSILLETETNLDQDFQELYLSTIQNETNSSSEQLNFESITNKDLIFLYSAMARIAEIPLSESFLKVDSKNLAIPIILNQSTPISLRIKAANNSYLENNLSIESLAALYQSVDFNSNQLNNPEETLLEITNNIEMSMAYHFQLINIQIFPSERIKELLNFWSFAQKNDLQEIAYALSYKIIQSIEISAENIEYSPKIATAFILNNDFENALKWLEFYENSKGIDEKSSYVKILLNLHSVKDINSLTDIIKNNLQNISDLENQKNKELMFVILNVLQDSKDDYLTDDYSDIFDQRLMPSMYILHNLKDSINSNDEKLLTYSIISMNNKEWYQIHPEHLKLILLGFLSYKDGLLIEKIILEIFKNYKII